MSLVEKTLRKLQDAAAHAAQRSSPVPHPAPTASVSVETAERRLVPTRAAPINIPALRAAGLLPPEHEERRLAHQYRQIKRPLIVNALGRGTASVDNGQVIMIASALPGEGKTFTALNLALSMSMEKDVRVLLMDLDVAKPHISGLFGMSEGPGLLDALRDPGCEVERLILGTSVPNLYFLPAGTSSAQATEFLASARMEETIRTLGQRDRQRIIVFDSPPLLQTTESRVLAQIAGQIVVVVRAAETSQQTLLDALGYLGEHPAVSLVLNQSMATVREGYYEGAYGESRPGPVKKQPGT